VSIIISLYRSNEFRCLFRGFLFHIFIFSYSYGSVLYHWINECMFCMLLFNFVNCVCVCELLLWYVPFWVSCFIVFFCVLFVYKCVLYCCHRVSTQLLITNIVKLSALCVSHLWLSNKISLCRVSVLMWGCVSNHIDRLR